MTLPAHAFIGAGAMMNSMTMMIPATMGMGGMMPARMAVNPWAGGFPGAGTAPRPAAFPFVAALR